MGDGIDAQRLELDIAQIREALSTSIRQPVYEVFDRDHVASESGEEFDSDSGDDSHCPPAPPSRSLTQRSSTVSTSYLSDGRTSETQVVTLDELDLDPSLENCLALNRVYQDLLTENIRQAELLLAANKERQQELQLEIDEAVSKNRPLRGAPISKKNNPALGVFTVPYFKDSQFLPCPSNEDALLLRDLQQYSPYIKAHKPWQKSERVDLVSAIKKNRLEILLRPLSTRKENLCSKLVGVMQGSEEERKVKDKINAVNDEIMAMSKSPRKNFNYHEEHEFDWLRISATTFQGSRTPQDCELFWKNYESHNVNKAKWTKEESETLYRIATKYQFRNWEDIAAELNTRRSGLQCLNHYQTKLNKAFCKSKWTPVEDQLLREAVDSCRIGDYIPWHHVAYCMENRTRSQVVRRWRNCICPVLRKGKWSIEEEMLLFLAHKDFSTNWCRISAHIPGRTGSQIREKWYTALNDEVSVAAWTKEEDMMILDLIEKYGKRWSTIARDMTGRTDSMIMNRYNKFVWWVRHLTKRRVTDVTKEDLQKYGHPYQCDRTGLKGHKYVVLAKLHDVIHKYLPNSQAAREDTGEKALEKLTHGQTELLISRLSSSIQEDRSVQDAETVIIRKKYQRKHKVVLEPKLTVPAAKPVDPIDEEITNYIMLSCQPNRRPKEPSGDEVLLHKATVLFNNLLRKNSDLSDIGDLRIGTGNDEIPLIPPNFTTISAFRQLLLSRNILKQEQIVGWGQYVPGIVISGSGDLQPRNGEIRNGQSKAEGASGPTVNGFSGPSASSSKLSFPVLSTPTQPTINGFAGPSASGSKLSFPVLSTPSQQGIPELADTKPFVTPVTTPDPAALPSEVIQAILRSIDPRLVTPGAHYRVVPPSPNAFPRHLMMSPSLLGSPPAPPPSIPAFRLPVPSSSRLQVSVVPQSTPNRARMLRITDSSYKSRKVNTTDEGTPTPPHLTGIHSQSTPKSVTYRDNQTPPFLSPAASRVVTSEFPVQDTEANRSAANAVVTGIYANRNPLPAKRKRGRPRKVVDEDVDTTMQSHSDNSKLEFENTPSCFNTPPRKRGRASKHSNAVRKSDNESENYSKPARSACKADDNDVMSKFTVEELLNQKLAYTGSMTSCLRTSSRPVDIALVKTTPEFQLLFARFMSLFFWPTLLATIKLDELDDDRDMKPRIRMQILNRRPRKPYKKKYMRRPWVAERMRKVKNETTDEDSGSKKTKVKSKRTGRPFGAKNKTYDGPRRASSRRREPVNLEENETDSEVNE